MRTSPSGHSLGEIRVTVSQVRAIAKTMPRKMRDRNPLLGFLTALGISAGCWTFLTITLARLLR